MLQMYLRAIKHVSLCDKKIFILKHYYHVNKNGEFMLNKCNTSIRLLAKRYQSSFKKETLSNTRKLAAVFLGGVAAFSLADYFLEKYSSDKKQKKQINYSSQNLPGIIKPSKSVFF